MSKKVRTLSTDAGNELARTKAAERHEEAHAVQEIVQPEQPVDVQELATEAETPEVDAAALLAEEQAKAAAAEEAERARAEAQAKQQAETTARLAARVAQEQQIAAERAHAMHTNQAPPITNNIAAVQKINRSLGGFQF